MAPAYIQRRYKINWQYADSHLLFFLHLLIIIHGYAHLFQDYILSLEERRRILRSCLGIHKNISEMPLSLFPRYRSQQNIATSQVDSVHRSIAEGDISLGNNSLRR
ncbi:hypothetical protein BDW72DRAFT_89328 [Aspergillus terricola var. indicus]